MTCLFLAVTALEDWDIYNINVKTVYLYSNLDKEIYIEQSEDFRLSDKEKKSDDSTKYCMDLSKLAYFSSRL